MRDGTKQISSHIIITQGELLQSIAPPTKALHCTSRMCVNHSTLIDDYYCSIVSSLQQASAKFVPKIPLTALKHTGIVN